MADRYAVWFCAGSATIDPKFNILADKAVRAACELGYGAVSGGTIRGTMKIVADAAQACGAPNRGILPRFMKGLEHPGLTELIWTDTMSERKEEMRKGTCLAIALPGGVGTMDEFFETFTLAKLKKYDGRLVAFNYDGFYDGLKALLDHFVETEMLDRESRTLVSFPETLDEFISCIR